MPYSRFEQLYFGYFEQFKRLQEATPLVLGGASGAGGGFGGRPGGFIGYLPQTRIAFDSDEFEIWNIPEVSGSLLDNLNRIRYRISQLEGSGGSISVYESGVEIASGVTVLDFLTDNIIEISPGYVTISGNPSAITFLDLNDTPNTYTGQANRTVAVKSDESGLEFISISGGGDSFKIKVSSDDTTEDYLDKKIVGGDNVNITTISGGSNEHLDISIPTIPWEDITGKPYRTITFGQMGALEVKTLEARLHAPFSGTIVNVTATVNTEPQGASIILDVMKNGSTVFTTSANRPTIAAGNKNDLSSIPDITSFSLDDLFTVEIVQIGSTTAGSDLVLQIRCNT